MPNTPITIAQARACVLLATPRLGEERVPIGDALDRVLARDVRATGDVPPFACSAMDGYALKAGPAARTLNVIGESRAGAPSLRLVGDGEAIRISTGGAIPAGAEAVIRQEDVVPGNGQIATTAAVAPGENVREAGEDMRAGTTSVPAGTTLRAAELGAVVAADHVFAPFLSTESMYTHGITFGGHPVQ